MLQSMTTANVITGLRRHPLHEAQQGCADPSGMTVTQRQHYGWRLHTLTASPLLLQAVHSGADLNAAVRSVMGYDAVSMKGKKIKVEPVAGVATPGLGALLEAALRARAAAVRAYQLGSYPGRDVIKFVSLTLAPMRP